MTTDSLLIDVTRGTMVESRHRVALAIADADGKVLESLGIIDRPIYGRSAIKPLQAIPLVESGAADHFALSDEEIALACASHNSEPRHVETVRAWLSKIGCTVADLECGTHLPYHEPTLHHMLRTSQQADASYNNCSGKHAGFLTTARFYQEPTKGYILADHPVQRRLRQVLSEMSGETLTEAPHGVDGCGIPVIGVTLAGTARAFANMANPKHLDAKRADAARRILTAMSTHPFMVAGTGRFCTDIMAHTGTKAAIKTGAEGVYAAAFPEVGIGVALKAEDGASRAAETAMGWVLQHLGILKNDDVTALQPVLMPTLRNRAGLDVGTIRPAQRP